MFDPRITLTAGLLLLGLAALMWWPEKGVISWWKRTRRTNTQVLREDLLKQLHKQEIKGQGVTPESLAGATGIGRDETAVLLQELQQMGLVTLDGETLHLTREGREIALHIIRAHRLWEHYLAEQTGYGAAEWHTLAEEQEHMLSPEALNMLAAQLGNPLRDPHGDPIPTDIGALVTHGGVPLTTLKVDARAEIVHLEDEPDVVYAQLVAEGLYPGQEIRLTEISDQRVCFWAGGNEHVLAPLVAGNIAVRPLREQTQNGTMLATPRLSDLPLGKTAIIKRIAPQCRGVERRRMLDLGIVPGTRVEAALRSPSGEPTAYRIRGALIALRSEQAALIELELAESVEQEFRMETTSA